MSLRAVVDTNILVSSALTPHGQPDLVVRLALSGAYQLVASDELFLEYEGVLGRPEFRLPPQKIQKVIAALRASAIMVFPAAIAKGICSDHDDAFILGTAVAGKAEFLITGNVKHFPKTHQGVEVIAPREFLVRVKPR